MDTLSVDKSLSVRIQNNDLIHKKQLVKQTQRTNAFKVKTNLKLKN